MGAQAGLAGVLGMAGSGNIQVSLVLKTAGTVPAYISGPLVLIILEAQHSSRLRPCIAPQGEDQKKLDVLANEVFVNVLRRCGQCSVLVSSSALLLCDNARS